jgi:hypothetical protein
MPKTTEQVGEHSVSVAWCTPANPEENRRRRINALTAWLLAQWESQHEEGEHDDASDTE